MSDINLIQKAPAPFRASLIMSGWAMNVALGQASRMAWLPSQWSPWTWVSNTWVTGLSVVLRICSTTMRPTCTLEPGSITTTPSFVTIQAGLFMKLSLAAEGRPCGPWMT